MSEPTKRDKSPQSDTPKDKTQILSMAENIQKSDHERQLPEEYIIKPVRTVAGFTGERWPFSNVEPAVYSTLGLLYGRSDAVDDTGALINSDMEYSIHNVLTGHALGLFFCLPDNSLSMSYYGFNTVKIEAQGLSQPEIRDIIIKQISEGVAVHFDEGDGEFDYLFWGYRDNGGVLVGHKYEHGNDMLNCSYDFDKPAELSSLPERIKDISVYRPDGVKSPRGEIFRKALEQAYRMIVQSAPPSGMDFSRVHFGYGGAVYEEWIHQLEQANSEGSEAFYFVSPIFPHFIALYENRLHLYKFLKLLSETQTSLSDAAQVCGRLMELSRDGAQITYENQWSDPEVLAMTNNQRRELLIDILKRCRALELETADYIKVYLEKTQD